MKNKKVQDDFKAVNTSRKWGRYLIKDWQKAFRKKKINIGATFRSFESNVRGTGHKSSIELSYRIGGMFTDMGVGRGIDIGDAREKRTLARESTKALARQIGGRRVRKPWTNKILYRSMGRLTWIMARGYGEEYEAKALDVFPEEIKL